jgi:hypothetical protein
MRAASRCGNRAEAIGLLVWYAVGLTRAHSIKLTPSMLKEFNVHPKTARRTLKRMAELGLVAVDFHRGRSPQVTVLPWRAAINQASGESVETASDSNQIQEFRVL